MQKDTLFYKSEKGRDLYWCKGWYSAFSQIKDWVTRLDFWHDIKKQKAAGSLFDDDEFEEF